MLLKNDLTKFINNVHTGLKLKKINLDFRELEAHCDHSYAISVNIHSSLSVTQKTCSASHGEIERDISRYFLMKQDFIKDDMCIIIQKVEEINKKLESRAK
ncbi:5778_t:CDS:2, partial [Gigaspora margarita]